MILEEFDPTYEAVLNPNMVIDPVNNFPEVTIACFSWQLFDTVLRSFDPKPIYTLSGYGHQRHVFQVDYGGKRFAFYLASMGEPRAIMEYEELIAAGSKRLILFGNCGVLDKSIEDCGIIIPTQAIRDEGCSYHYAPPGDMLPVNNQYTELFREVLREANLPWVEGITWTTDAIYRETRKKIELRKKQGAICVEMECAGMQALCSFRNTEFFQFFYAGDNLDGVTWEPRSVHGHLRLDDKCKIALLAFELGYKILKNERG